MVKINSIQFKGLEFTATLEINGKVVTTHGEISPIDQFDSVGSVYFYDIAAIYAECLNDEIQMRWASL